MQQSYRRSLLYVPGDKERMVQKAMDSKSDSVIIDWEDAVAPVCKKTARQVTKTFFEEHEVSKEVFIRINDTQSPEYEEDLALAITLPIAGIVLPKASPESVKTAGEDLKKHQVREDFLMIPLIESAYGLQHLGATIEASSFVAAVQFGAEDYTRDLEIARTKSGEEVLLARQQIGLACRSYGIQAIDTPYVDFKDPEGLQHDIDVAKQAGMKAKTAIHPAQLELINQGFRPTQAEIEFATQVMEAAQLPENQTLGAFSLNGKMVDAPVIDRARRVLEREKHYREI